jgi:hypothetical protein
MTYIFLSYKREDQPFVETLRERLIGWGHSVWMDVHDIPPGAYWPDAIDEGINAAHTVIGVISPEAVKSRNVKNEWDWAIVNGKRLILLMLEACTVPVNYLSINYIDATFDHDTAFDRLRAALDVPADPPATLTDPYLTYLQALYERINTMLAQKIIKLDDRKEPQPIDLISRRTRGAVDALFEQQDEIDPFFAALGIEDQQPKWETGDFRTAYDHFGGRVLLLGEPGAGKTITLLHFGRDEVVQRIQNPAASLPILALIPMWDSHAPTPLAEWIAGSYGAPANAIEVIESGRALLLLDGLDELGGEREEDDPNNPDQRTRYDPRERFVAALTEFAGADASQGSTHTPLQNGVIVTCRGKDYHDIGTKIPLSGAVTLQSLSDAQIRNYLNELPDLWAALESDAQLREIARTPLLLSCFAFAYRDMTPEDTVQLRDLTDSPGDLRDAIFERYVRERYAHEERKLRQRREAMPFSLDEIYRVLGGVVMENVATGLKGTTSILFREENVLIHRDFEMALPDTEIVPFLELAIRLNLLAQGEITHFHFIHLLLRDYFAFGHALSAMGDLNSSVRYYAVHALGRVRDTRAIEPLVAALSDADFLVRETAARYLGWFRDTRAIEPLIVALGNFEGVVVAHALEQIGNPAVEPLIIALQEVNERVRIRIFYALTRIGTAEAFAALDAWRASQTSHPSDEV